jgi:uncharacterized protein
MRMRLISGREVDPLNVLGDDLNAWDIAHALSMLCRYGGHVQFFYSVAQHSVNVEKALRALGCDEPKMLRTALMHDATEAYLGDIIAPIKEHVRHFQEVEDDLWRVMARRFDCYVEIPLDVKQIDFDIRFWEMAWLMPGGLKLMRDREGVLMRRLTPSQARTGMMRAMKRLGVV